MKLRFLKGRLSGREVEVRAGGFNLGRSADNDLQIDEDGISRRHCRVFHEDGTWFVEDLGSTNGVRVNGTKVTGRFLIKSGDRIGLFNQTLLFTDGSDLVDVAALDTPGAAAKDDAGAAATRSAPGAKGFAEAPEAGGAAELVTVPAAGGRIPLPESRAAAARAEGTTPWGRIVLLLLLVAALAWFIKISLDKPADGSGASPAAGERGPAGGVPVELVSEPPAVVVEIPGSGTNNAFQQDEVTPVVQVATFDDAPPVIVAVAPGDGQEAQPEGPAVTILVESIPSGASVTMGGVLRGQTPLLIQQVPAGRHELVLSKPGYDELTRQIRNPGVLPEQPYPLELKAGALRITSTPEGASVVHGSQLVGTTPLVITDLPIGPQQFRLVKFGYESAVKDIAIAAARGVEEHVVLDSLLGGIDFITAPAGCRVFVDGVLKGMTVRGDQQRNKSLPLRVHGLKEGEHVARVEHPNGVAKNEKVQIKRGVTSTHFVEFWVVDTKIVLNDGTERYGMLFSVNDAGDVILNERSVEEKSALSRQYLKEQIAEIVAVEPAEARKIMEKLGIVKATGGKDEPAKVEPGPMTLAPEDGWTEAADAGPALSYTAEQLTTVIRENSATALAKMLGGRELVVTGTPTAARATLVRAELEFGRSIDCEMDVRTYERYRHEIENARDNGGTITIRGKPVARAQSLTLRQCQYIPKAETEGNE